MRDHPKHSVPTTGSSALLTVGTLVLIVGILHWAREVLMPLALAILLSFILSPIVSLLRRRGLGQKISVMFTVVLAFLLIGGIGMLLLAQFRGLANELPAYQQNIRKKVADLHVVIKAGSLGKVHQTVQDVMQELKKEDPPEVKSAAPIPVVVKDADGGFDLAFVRPLLGPAITASLVVVLIVFMLLRREDLRDRLLQLAGHGRLAATTKAIDEAGKQVSRFLLRQFLVNTGFGVVAGLGFGMIGLPYALLWGFFAGVARFVPYLGFVLGVSGPLLMSLAVFDGWSVLFLVVGLFIALELLAGLLIEPLVYGQGIGVSEVALLVMIAFWTWLWGGVGLLLATPLTVCLVVISKSVPRFKFIAVLLSREPALDLHRVFYHRLIAKETEEIQRMVDRFLVDHSRLELFEQWFIPALIACRGDCRRHELTDEDRDFIFQTIRRMVQKESNPDHNVDETRPASEESESPARGAKRWMLGCPANDEADELALLMLARSLGDEHWPMRVLSAEMLSAEALAEIKENRPSVLCLGLLPHGPTLPARQLCKRIQVRFLHLPVILGCWGAPDPERMRRRFAGLVTEPGWTLSETRNQLIQYGQMETVSTPREHFRETNPGIVPFLNGNGTAPEEVKITFIEQKL